MIPKFRAYSTEENEMYYPHNDKNVDWTMDDETGFIAPLVNLGSGMWGMIDKYELMQSTGLKDKNGVEIYEGDVLFHPLQGRRKVFYPYSETVASYGLRNIDNGFGSTLQDSHVVWEVIGNIYQNKDLLEAE